MQRLNFLLESGGPVIVLLIVMSVLSLAIFILKCWQYAKLRVFDRSFVNPAINAWRSGRADQARALVAGHPAPMARTLEAVMRMQATGAAREDTAAEAARVAALHLEEMRRLLRPLEVIAYLSPLLGLLGTVIGMIRAFRELELAGSRIDPSLLSGGIWEALLTTAAGLIVEEPGYSRLAARLLSTYIDKEVRNQNIPWFTESVARGHSLGVERTALDLRDAVGRMTRPRVPQNNLWREQHESTR